MLTEGTMDDEKKIDPALWFTLANCEGRHFVLYNSHTFHGRLTAWCPNKGRSVNVSKSELQTSSEETKYWLKGFLAGNEPEPPRNGAGTVEAVDSEPFRRWLRAVELFAETGYWYEGERRCEKCDQVLLPSALRCPCAEGDRKG